ncbi:MAG: hypothetical protein IT463_13580 [Planctomycetes bacterium]|nr:hypothetical protein [Planctomycetota bacterium]
MSTPAGWFRRVLLAAAGGLLLFAGADAQGIRISSRSRIVEPARPASQSPAGPAVEPVEPAPEERDRIAELIEQLGASRLSQRDRAMGELARYGAKALGQVREGRKNDDDEIANRCALLEEVIQSRKAELFLAARQLNLSPGELENLLAGGDVQKLLGLLKSRAQPGMSALWARVLAGLCGRNEVFPTVELCQSLEGGEGYGAALVEAAQGLKATELGGQLMQVVVWCPPLRPADALATLAWCASVQDGAVSVLVEHARALRGYYGAAELLAAARLNTGERKLSPDAAELVPAMALAAVERCTADELRAGALPPLDRMSTAVLEEYLALLVRSGLSRQLENAMVALTARGDARLLSLICAYYAQGASLADALAVFDSLPASARLAMLDSWAVLPRDARVLQPFLCGLLTRKEAWLRDGAARLLAQYRAPSTARALAQCALTTPDSAPAALRALALMAELLEPADVSALAALLPTAGHWVRPALVEVLLAGKQPAADAALDQAWKQTLPRAELLQALRFFARNRATPAGAFAASQVLLASTAGAGATLRALQQMEPADLELMRALLALPPEQGLELLRRTADDLTDPLRPTAAMALAAGGLEEDRAAEWIRRMAGEVWDPEPAGLTAALSLSNQPAAVQFRRDALKQGPESEHFGLVSMAVLMGREGITREEWLAAVLDKPELGLPSLASVFAGDLPPAAAQQLLSATLFGSGESDALHPAMLMYLRHCGLDPLAVLYGSTEKPEPRDARQILLTALLADRARAVVILKDRSPRPDGSDWQALRTAQALLGLLPAPVAGQVLNAARLAGQPVEMDGVLRRLDAGNVGALRELLDSYSPAAQVLKKSSTALVGMVRERWRTEMRIEGAAEGAFGQPEEPSDLPVRALNSRLSQPLPDEWYAWWACRRGLLEFDRAAGRFTFVELP